MRDFDGVRRADDLPSGRALPERDDAPMVPVCRSKETFMRLNSFFCCASAMRACIRRLVRFLDAAPSVPGCGVLPSRAVSRPAFIGETVTLSSTGIDDVEAPNTVP